MLLNVQCYGLPANFDEFQKTYTSNNYSFFPPILKHNNFATLFSYLHCTQMIQNFPGHHPKCNITALYLLSNVLYKRMFAHYSM